MFLRALIVIVVYALSGAGFLFMLVGAFPFLGGELFFFAKLAPIVWIFAWVSHVRMSVAWIRNRTLSRRWPIWGTAAGLFSLASPLLVVLGPAASTLHQVNSALITIALVTVFFLPSILLAVKLVRFHLNEDSEK